MSAVAKELPPRAAPVHGDVIVRAKGVAKYFDVSLPWLNRVIERKPRSILHAVDGVSFEIRRGETLALVGESGCGKSTVARLLVGLYTPTRGSVEFFGRDLRDMNSAGGRALRQKLQMIFQDPYASLNPRWTVGDIVAEPIRELKLLDSEDAIRARVGDLLETVGLARADAARFPHAFSGGQRQRISIARALATEADVLVCDEPTSALDVSVQAQILNLMRRLQAELELTYILISHNLSVVRHMSDDIAIMYLGRFVETGPAEQVFTQPRHPYTKLLLETIPDVERPDRDRQPLSGEVPSPIDPPPGCPFHPRCPIAVAACQQQRPALLRNGATAVACAVV